MSQPTLSADERTIVGKKVKSLRKKGLVPGVIYGPALKETIQITVDERAFAKFYQIHGHSTLIQLNSEGKHYQVLIRDVQLEPVRRNPIHVDFFAPNLKKETTASVLLVMHNVPDGPGNFNQQLSELHVSGLPRQIPARLEVDCSVLQAEGDSIRVADLVIPAGITVLSHGDEMVATLTPKMSAAAFAAEEAEAAGETAVEAPAEEASDKAAEAKAAEGE